MLYVYHNLSHLRYSIGSVVVALEINLEIWTQTVKTSVKRLIFSFMAFYWCSYIIHIYLYIRVLCYSISCLLLLLLEAMLVVVVAIEKTSWNWWQEMLQLVVISVNWWFVSIIPRELVGRYPCEFCIQLCVWSGDRLETTWDAALHDTLFYTRRCSSKNRCCISTIDFIYSLSLQYKF